MLSSTLLLKLTPCCCGCVLPWKPFACATHHPTGIVVAVRGRAEPGGDFVVSDVMWPGLAPQPERPLMDQDKYVALVSGLQLADRKSDKMQVRGSTGGGSSGEGEKCGAVLFDGGVAEVLQWGHHPEFKLELHGQQHHPFLGKLHVL